MKVTIDIARKLYAMSEYKKIENVKDSDLIIVKSDDADYIVVCMYDVPQYDSYCNDSYWEAYAVKIGDEIDDDEYAPTYEIRWYLDDLDAEDGGNTVDDWEHPEVIKLLGAICIEDGRHV